MHGLERRLGERCAAYLLLHVCVTVWSHVCLTHMQCQPVGFL